MYCGFSTIFDGIWYSDGPGYLGGLYAGFLSFLLIDHYEDVFYFVVYPSSGSTWPGPGTLVNLLGLTNSASIYQKIWDY